jgi:hypothetical protein
MWADGHDLGTIRQEVGLDAQDTTTLVALWHRLRGRSPGISAVIEDVTGWHPPDKRQRDLGLE